MWRAAVAFAVGAVIWMAAALGGWVTAAIARRLLGAKLAGPYVPQYGRAAAL